MLCFHLLTKKSAAWRRLPDRRLSPDRRYMFRAICIWSVVQQPIYQNLFQRLVDPRSFLFFLFFCRHTMSLVQHLRKIRIPKCPPTDNRNKMCLPLARRWSRIVRRAIQRLLKLKKSAFDAEKNPFITWPDGHKISRPMKKDVDIGPAKTSWAADWRPDNQLFASKTIGR